MKYVYNKDSKKLIELSAEPHTGAFDEYYLNPKYIFLYDYDYIEGVKQKMKGIIFEELHSLFISQGAQPVLDVILNNNQKKQG